MNPRENAQTHTESRLGVLLIVSKAVLVKFLDGVEPMWAFPKTQIPSYCKMHAVADIIWLFCIKYEVGGWLPKLFTVTWIRVCFDPSFLFLFFQILPTDRQVMWWWSRKDAKAGQQEHQQLFSQSQLQHQARSNLCMTTSIELYTFIPEFWWPCLNF